MSREKQRRKEQFARVVERDNHACAYCGCSLRYTTTPCPHEPGVLTIHGTPPTLDHIIPRARGGSNRDENLTAFCLSCNAQKGRMTADEYRAWKAARP